MLTLLSFKIKEIDLSKAKILSNRFSLFMIFLAFIIPFIIGDN